MIWRQLQMRGQRLNHFRLCGDSWWLQMRGQYLNQFRLCNHSWRTNGGHEEGLYTVLISSSRQPAGGRQQPAGECLQL